MRRKDNARVIRPLTARERELLMFWGRKATQHAMNPVHAKRDLQALEDARCCLIGNGFNACVVALLVAPLVVSRGLFDRRPSPQDHVDRMGLLPGEVGFLGFVCSLDRPPRMHRLDDQ